jgi:hypothetical protein
MLVDDGVSERGEEQPWRPSIDRIDPAMGYVRDNVRLVAWIVNASLNDWKLQDFLEMCRSVTQQQMDGDYGKCE